MLSNNKNRGNLIFKKTQLAGSIITLIENNKNAKDLILFTVFVCGIFTDLQKSTDNVDHNILLYKCHHCGTWYVGNNCLSFYLCNRKQFVSIYGFNSTAQSPGNGIPRSQF